MIKKLLPLSATLIITSCGVIPAKTINYNTSETQDLSTIAILGEGERGHGHVTHINGKALFPTGFGHSTMGIKIKPGTYELTLLYFQQAHSYYKKAEKTLTIRLEEGHYYMPSAKFISSDFIKFEVNDMGTSYPIECLSNHMMSEKPNNC
ncbi:hypothetical protein ACJRW5_22470 [Pseudomonas sp. SH1-B]